MSSHSWQYSSEYSSLADSDTNSPHYENHFFLILSFLPLYIMTNWLMGLEFSSFMDQPPTPWLASFKSSVMEHIWSWRRKAFELQFGEDLDMKFIITLVIPLGVLSSYSVPLYFWKMHKILPLSSRCVLQTDFASSS